MTEFELYKKLIKSWGFKRSWSFDSIMCRIMNGTYFYKKRNEYNNFPWKEAEGRGEDNFCFIHPEDGKISSLHFMMWTGANTFFEVQNKKDFDRIFLSDIRDVKLKSLK
jgi:hypothetical protein